MARKRMSTMEAGTLLKLREAALEPGSQLPYDQAMDLQEEDS